MAIPQYLPTFDVDVENIQALSNLPNEDDGLSAEELKAIFDKAAVDIKEYINSVLLDAIETAIATKAAGGDPSGINGSNILDGTITTMKLSSEAGQEAVTGAVIRDGTIPASKFTSDLRGRLERLPDDINTWTVLLEQFETDLGNYDTNIANLDNVTENHTTQITNLQGADTAISTRIDQLATEVHGNTGSSGTGGIQEELTTLDGRIDTLASEVHGTGGIDASITTINNEISDLQDEDSDLGDRITVLETDMNGDGVDVGVKSKVSTLMGVYSTLNSAVTSMQQTINALNTTYQKKHIQVNTIKLAGGNTSWHVSCASAKATSAIFASPDGGSYSTWRDYGVFLSGQSDGYLDFTAAASTPSQISVNVVIFDV